MGMHLAKNLVTTGIDHGSFALKLELPIAAAARLLERSFNRLEGNQGIKQHLVSMYFDTGKHALRKHGLTLRITVGTGIF